MEQDQIRNGATSHDAEPLLLISFLLMLWRLWEAGYQLAWYDMARYDKLFR